MTNFVTGKVENMTRLKELLKDKKVKVVAGVAAVIVLIAVGTTAVCVSGGNKNKQTAAQETQQQTTAVATAKKTEQTTATMEIAQAQTGAGETTAVATAVAEETKVENETPAEEAIAEALQQAEPVEIPHREETVSENTGNDTEESNEPEEVEDTGSNEPEEAPAPEPTPEPTPEPATEAAPSLTDEERLVATGKWVFNYECDMPRGHRVDYGYTDSITGYTIYSTFINGKYSGGSSNGPEEIKAIFDAHGISDGAKMTIDTMLML